MSTIFISVASLRDPEIFKTINDAFKKAKKPKNVYIGLHYQYAILQEKKDAEEKLKKYKNLRIKFSYVKDTLGIASGRNGAKSLYNNEDYILQIDSHTKFEKGWDEHLISLLHKAVNYVGSEKIILSAYLNEYTYKTSRKRILVNTTRPSWTYMTNDKLVLNCLPLWANHYGKIEESKPFIPARKFSANFVFTFGKYEDLLTLDPEVKFWSEEYSKTLDLILKGYAIVHPNQEVRLTHLYQNNINNQGGQRFTVDNYLTDTFEYWFEEEKYIYDKLEGIQNKNIYEDYAGIKFYKQMCKSKFYVPSSFFPLDRV